MVLMPRCRANALLAARRRVEKSRGVVGKVCMAWAKPNSAAEWHTWILDAHINEAIVGKKAFLKESFFTRPAHPKGMLALGY